MASYFRHVCRKLNKFTSRPILQKFSPLIRTFVPRGQHALFAQLRYTGLPPSFAKCHRDQRRYQAVILVYDIR